MGQYLSPPIPSDYKTKCAIIFYPADDGAFYLQALKGQLSKLALRWIWEGSDAKQREIADIWLAHDLMTDAVFFRLDCDDIPFIIGDETLNINVNCNCGCGGVGGEPTTIICYDADGNPVVTPQPPVEPYQEPPVGTGWPVEPAYDEPPTGFADWTEFDSEACAAANGLWQAAYAWVTIAEGGIDLIATVAAALAVFAAQALAELLAVIGGASLIKMGEALVRIILSEQASDILNEAKTWLEANKNEIVCTIFRLRYDIPTMQIELVRMLYAYVDDVLTLDDEEQAALREWARTLFPLNLLIAYFFEYQRYIAASAPIDCATCPQPTFTYESAYPNDFAISFQNGISFYGSGVTHVASPIDSRAWVGVLEGINVPTAMAVEAVFDVDIDSLSGYEWGFMQTIIRNVNATTPALGETVILYKAGYLGSLAGYDHAIEVADLDLPEMTGEWATGIVTVNRVSASPSVLDVTINMYNLAFRDINGDLIA